MRPLNGLVKLAAIGVLVMGGSWIPANGEDREVGSGPGSVPLGRLTDRALDEISGCVASRRFSDILWMHNDGAEGRLFAVRPDGRVVAVFRLNGRFVDIEDVALGAGPAGGRDPLYLGDIGDNDEKRDFVQLIRLPEPDPYSGADARRAGTPQEVEVFRMRYPDSSHDAEALLADPQTGHLFVVTKEKRRARIYRIRQEQLQPDGIATMTLVAEVPFSEVSAGDISPNGRHVILRSEARGAVWTRADGELSAQTFRRVPYRAAVVGPPAEPNGESVAWRPDGEGYYTVSEGDGQLVYFVPWGGAVQASPVEWP